MESGSHDSFYIPSSGLSKTEGLSPYAMSKSEEQQRSPLPPSALCPSPSPYDKGAGNKAARALLWQISLRALGMPSPVLIKPQGYRQADGLVLGLGKETSLRYKVKGQKEWTPLAVMWVSPALCVLLGYQETLP